MMEPLSNLEKCPVCGIDLDWDENCHVNFCDDEDPDYRVYFWECPECKWESEYFE
jgi:endogenous inhibitor of DNA gyrase (YacG/DUF329 family)